MQTRRSVRLHAHAARSHRPEAAHGAAARAASVACPARAPCWRGFPKLAGVNAKAVARTSHR
eukprot:scaffold58427_cov69-Phaeocystis_antarctica.AAC.1